MVGKEICVAGSTVHVCPGVPTQFLDKGIKFILGRDKWIKFKFWGQDKINCGQNWNKIIFQIRIPR